MNFFQAGSCERSCVHPEKIWIAASSSKKDRRNNQKFLEKQFILHFRGKLIFQMSFVVLFEQWFVELFEKKSLHSLAEIHDRYCEFAAI